MACENFSLGVVSYFASRWRGCGGRSLDSHSFGELLGAEELVALSLERIGHSERVWCFLG